MKVFFRTDASRLIGTGHVMRCLTLAEYLKRRGVEVGFVCRELPGHLCELIEGRGLALWRLPGPDQVSSDVDPNDYRRWLAVKWQQDAEETGAALKRSGVVCDWLVVDHYGLDARWQQAVRQRANRIMVIDDLANRLHDCDLLLDQNFYLDFEHRYDKLTPKRCRRLLGPAYALLRPEFLEVQRTLRPRDGRIKRVLVFYGGCDVTGETLKTLRGVMRLRPRGVDFDFVVGTVNEKAVEIRRLASEWSGVACHTNVSRMAEMMGRADLAFGGGGTTTWERCFLGLPTATVEVAENQRVMLHALLQREAVWHLGRHDEVSDDTIFRTLQRVLGAPDDVRTVGQNAMRIMAERSVGDECPVAEAMWQLS